MAASEANPLARLRIKVRIRSHLTFANVSVACVIGAAALALMMGVGLANGRTRVSTGKSGCPRASRLAYPHHIRGAIPAAKQASFGKQGHVKRVKHGKHAPRAYHLQARNQCGERVVRKSVYVEVAPKGQTCAACIFHGFVAHSKGGHWKVWAAF